MKGLEKSPFANRMTSMKVRESTRLSEHLYRHINVPNFSRNAKLDQALMYYSRKLIAVFMPCFSSFRILCALWYYLEVMADEQA